MGPIGASRRLLVQAVGVVLVGLALSQLAPWVLVIPWGVGILAAARIEDILVQRPAAPEASRRRRLAAVRLRTASSGLWAAASLALLVRGSPAEQLLACALMAVSSVDVLMRYYYSRRVVALAISPHLLVLLLMACDLIAKAWKAGDDIGALTPVTIVVLFAGLFWSARAQLAETLSALVKASTEARDGERVAREASLAKSNFLATIGHELRTPLNGVLGMAQAMGAGSLSGEQRAQLKVIRRSGESLAAVLNDLLDISKIEAGELQLDVSDFDLEHLARGMVFAFGHQAEAKGLKFDFTIDDSATGHFMGDSARVRQVLYNLLSNAVKFTETGEINFSISADSKGVTLRVTDTGIGISPQDLTRLFESFFQADASNTRKFGGAGLGLTICNELVTLMNGHIQASSVPGEGSTFVVMLPLARATKAPEREASTGREEADGEPPPLRVLAAEDNEVNQLVLKTLLSQAGINATMVSDGAQALAAWEREAWDVVLMDIQMPVMDGVEATRAIRRRETQTGRARTPILAVTANAMVHQAEAYRAVGMDGLVPKPIEVAHLFGAIEEALAEEADPHPGGLHAVG